MLDTSARLLQLLSLLQARPRWTGPALADRLAVTPRTIRRDMDRLRRLGYPVEAEPGPDGGYRLGNGGDLPPLLLDDDEAVAVTVALGVAAGGAVQGIEDAGLSALAKLDRLLPPRLRSQVAALRSATTRLAGPTDAVEPGVLASIATAAAGHERMVLTYGDRDDVVTERRIEPYRLVSTGRRWYLLAFDVNRDDWRTFRVDRIHAAVATGHRFVPVDPPDARAVVQRAITVAPYRFQAVVRFEAAAKVIEALVPPTVGRTEPDGPGRCTLSAGADNLHSLLGHLVSLGHPFEVVEPPELRRLAASVGRSLAAGHRATRQGPRSQSSR